MPTTDFKLPGLGENITSGVVTKIMVKVGDTVKKDQMVIELETDKAVLEVPSPMEGVIKEILLKVGQSAKVGQVVMRLEEGATTTATPPTVATPQKPKEEEKKETPSAPPASLKTEIPTQTAPVEKEFPLPDYEPSLAKDVPAAPSVRRFAREIGIEISQVPGSGPKSRISIDDVKAFAKAINTGATGRPSSDSHVLQPPLPDFTKWGGVERQAMSMVRKKTAEHLSLAWSMIPHVTQFDKADVTELEKLRKRFAKKAESKGGKLTITAFLLKVLAGALKVFPQFNASVDMPRNEIIYKKYFHIGVAVDTDRGLIVPVIRDVDKKGIFDLAVELAQMAEKARNRKTTIEEMQGSSFTLTNLGGVGGTAFTPIINWPDVAILGVSRANLEPIYIEGQLVPRLLLPLSLSYDHRLIDGADGARFLRWVSEAIQQPLLIELEG